jgi:hypothetical protein
MAESEILRKILQGKVWIRYGESEIEIANPKNLQQKRTIHVPRELMPNVLSWIRKPSLMQPQEWDKIREYLWEYANIVLEMDLKGSSPNERKLKIAVFQEVIKKLEKEQKKAES